MWNLWKTVTFEIHETNKSKFLDMFEENKKKNQNIWNLFSSKHSYKKQKDSLEGSLDRVLFATELEFPKILVPRLPQHTNVNIQM